MSSDIDADAGYRVLSMSKNTTYFGLLSVVVAMISDELVYVRAAEVASEPQILYWV